MREDEDKDYKLEWRKAMDELVNLRQEYRELKEDKDYIKSLLDAEFKKGLNLKKENEKLRKQIQNYEQLLVNSYVGVEETLDGFVGKYVIWEDELQEYKNKNEMIGDE